MGAIKVVIEDDRQATLFVRASPPAMNLAHELEGRRRWLKGGGLAFEPTGSNIETIRGHLDDLVVLDRRGQDEPEPEPRGVYATPVESYPLQARALEAMDGKRRFALFSEQGTGKTKVAIDWAGSLWCKGEIDAVLVVAPKGVHRQWAESQIPQHCGLRNRSVAWWRGGSGARWVLWENEADREAPSIDWWAVNYDALRGKGMDAALDVLGHGDRKFALILDESHHVKNVKAKRWEACKELAGLKGCRARLLMTGTPIAKDLTDEWAQLRILDEAILGIRYVSSFRSKYCIMGGFEGRQVVGSRNVELFKAKTAPHVFRATKAELGIEAKQYDLWRFDMTLQQKKLYDDMRKNMLVWLDEDRFTSAQHAAVALLRLQQISNGWVTPEKDDPEDKDAPPPPPVDLFGKAADNPRVQALLELLAAGEEKAATIIWVRFRKDAAILASVLGDDCVQYHGGIDDAGRRWGLDHWLAEDGPPYFLATPGSGGTGLNLQGRCRRAVYWSNSENSIQRWQSEDRIHRIGVTGVCTYTDIVAAGSRDMAILANLRRKKSLSDLTLDDIKTQLEALEYDPSYFTADAILDDAAGNADEAFGG